MTDVRILVAGIGNVLRGDDGFGPAVIRELEAAASIPARVTLVELGIGGIGLVHELMDGYDALILIDAVDRGAEPGTLYMLEPMVPEAATLSGSTHHKLATDMHDGVPDSSFVLARAAGVLPAAVRILGCQPGDTEQFSMELSTAVGEAVPRAVEIIMNMVEVLGRTRKSG